MLVTIIGARPQFIKAAVVSKALKDAGVDEKIIHTGQHYDHKMSEVFWTELGIPPYEINLNVGSGTHGEQTAQMIVKIEKYLLENRRAIKGVLLYGDTNSTLSGAIAASKLEIPVVHVEAGLRSFNRSMPEEINRIVTDHLSSLLFCSSPTGVLQLQKEGITKNVYEVGDVMYDALLTFSGRLNGSMSQAHLPEDDFYLLTVHRQSNTDDPANLRAIFNAIDSWPGRFVWPVHPRTKKAFSDHGMEVPSNLQLANPFSYFEMLTALNKCLKVLTDSGGVQKEAYWMKKPCITLRQETEWVETLANNWNILTGPDTQKIQDAIAKKIDPSSWQELYGDGRASEKIAAKILELLY